MTRVLNGFGVILKFRDLVVLILKNRFRKFADRQLHAKRIHVEWRLEYERTTKSWINTLIEVRD